MKALILTLILCILFSACVAAPPAGGRETSSSDTQQTEASDTQQTEASDIQQTEASDNVTESASDTTASLIDDTQQLDPPPALPEGEYVYLYLEENSKYCKAQIPHVRISDALDAQINTSIDVMFTQRIEAAKEHAFGSYYVRYRTTQNGNIFSLMVWSDEGTSPGVKPIVYTVCIDLETNTVLSLPALLASRSLDYLSVMAVANAYSTYDGNFSNIIAKTDPGLHIDMVVYHLDTNQFFLDENGRLLIVGYYHACKFMSELEDERYWELWTVGCLYDPAAKKFEHLS